MKSNVCKIEKGTKDLAAILKESEKVAIYNELNHKQTLQLRLLCEEIDGILPEIIDDFSGELWIEFENGVCKVNVSITFEEFTAEKKTELLSLAKNNKNTSAVGITGKIRSSLENIFLDEDAIRTCSILAGAVHLAPGYVDYSYLWSLQQYKNILSTDEKSENWDELEKSVIAAVADDVIVGVKGRKANITIVKNFA